MAGKKKTSFTISSLLNENTLAHANNRHLEIPYNKLIPHEKNHYEMSDIEQMAATIEQFGLMQPLMVKPIQDSDTYRIVAGHRRHAGVKMLVEEEGLEIFRNIPCYVMDENEDETLTEIKLHVSNTSSRELSEHDKMVAIMELKNLIQQAKERDIAIKGKMRDLIAESMKLGATQVQKYMSIGEQASDEIKEAFREGEITMTEAYESTRSSSGQYDDEGGADAPESARAAAGGQKRQNTEDKPESSEEAQEGGVDVNVIKAAVTKFNAFKKASEAVNNAMLDTLIKRVEKQLGKITKEMVLE